MKRFWCTNCKREFRGEALHIFHCPICNESVIQKLPDYETVAQWEKRTGRKYPDTAPVYYCTGFGIPAIVCGSFMKAQFNDPNLPKNKRKDLVIVATEAGAPSNDWRPV